MTSAITGDASPGGSFWSANYAQGVKYLSWVMPMSYDYHAAGNTGPDCSALAAGHLPERHVQGVRHQDGHRCLKGRGVPSRKILLGVPFYGRGWTGVTQTRPGGTATGPAKGTEETGIEGYDVLIKTCPPTGTVAGTAYARCGDNWWTYDTPKTIAGKMLYAKHQKLGGGFFWDFSGDTAKAALTKAMAKG